MKCNQEDFKGYNVLQLKGEKSKYLERSRLHLLALCQDIMIDIFNLMA